ncbi:hypothetical protein D0A34_04625 [Microcoleus vaginatus PCC 9802]|nr:hypothetical protein D0A34_04625 [Microcoleus vaginatus PCC 9802]
MYAVALKRGTEEKILVPPQRFGERRGDRVLIARQKTRTTFEVKLTPMGIVLSLPAEQIFTGFTCN